MRTVISTASLIFFLAGAGAGAGDNAGGAASPHDTQRITADNMAIRGEEHSDCGLRPGAAVTTLPLIPHRTLLERRRRERRLMGLPDDSDLYREGPAPRGRRNLDDLKYRPAHQQVGALYQGYGTHYVDLWVGTPPQRQTVIVDTGSGITAFPCSGCAECGESYHTDSYFIEADSSTFTKLSCSECYRGRCSSSGVGGGEKACRISMSYQEGSSWSAYEGRDMAYAGGRHDQGVTESNERDGGKDGADPNNAAEFSFKLTFGCQVSLTGLFKTQLADGIMGMDNAGASFWSQMHDQGAMPEKKFSLCFNRQDLASREGTMAGALTLGGEDSRLRTSPMLLSKNVRSSGFYTVKLKKMYLREGGGVSAAFDPSKPVHRLDIDEGSLNSGGVIVDSGTTDTYMNRKIGSVFKTVWKDIVGKPYTHDPVKLTQEQLAALPTILFQIQPEDGSGQASLGNPETVVGLAGNLDLTSPGDIIIAMPASHYMEYDPSEDQYVARLYLEEGSGSVMGANLMMGHDVTFDIDGKTIGWAESDCDYSHLGDVGTVSEKGSGQGAGAGGGCGPACKVGIAFGSLAACFAAVALFVFCRHRREERELQVVAMNDLDPDGGEMEGLDQEIGVEESDDPNFEGHQIEVPSSVGDGTEYMEDMDTLGDGTFGQEGKSLYEKAGQRDGDHDGYHDDGGGHGEYHDDPRGFHDDHGGRGYDEDDGGDRHHGDRGGYDEDEDDRDYDSPGEDDYDSRRQDDFGNRVQGYDRDSRGGDDYDDHDPRRGGYDDYQDEHNKTHPID